jgi:hypothetical protein
MFAKEVFLGALVLCFKVGGCARKVRKFFVLTLDSSSPSFPLLFLDKDCSSVLISWDYLSLDLFFYWNFFPFLIQYLVLYILFRNHRKKEEFFSRNTILTENKTQQPKG